MLATPKERWNLWIASLSQAYMMILAWNYMTFDREALRLVLQNHKVNGMVD
jgi:hypothetical protein